MDETDITDHYAVVAAASDERSGLFWTTSNLTIDSQDRLGISDRGNEIDIEFGRLSSYYNGY